MPPSEIHEFDGFLLDVGERRLSRHAETIALAPKAHDLLVALVRRAGRLVTKQDLLELVPRFESAWCGSKCRARQPANGTPERPCRRAPRDPVSPRELSFRERH